MKLSKKLFAAAATLGLAVAATVGSTYAWFSMNSTVTATNMKVKVKTTHHLQIKEALEGTYGEEVVFDDTATAYVPTSCDNTNETLKWYKVKNYTGISYTEGTYHVDNTRFEEASAGDYYKKSVKIKSVSADAGNLVALFNVTGNAEHAVSPSLRVMLVYGASVKYIYTPTGVRDSYKAIKNLKEEDKAEEGETIVVSGDTSVLISELTADQEYTIDIYIWYEGQDTAACQSENMEAGATTGLTVGISFVVDD